MKAVLEKISTELYYYKSGKKIIGLHSNLRGDCSGLRGDCSDLRGDCSDLWGNINLAEITDEERKLKIDIEKIVIEKQNA
jgi:hypothetical protein